MIAFTKSPKNKAKSPSFSQGYDCVKARVRASRNGKIKKPIPNAKKYAGHILSILRSMKFPVFIFLISCFSVNNRKVIKKPLSTKNRVTPNPPKSLFINEVLNPISSTSGKVCEIITTNAAINRIPFSEGK